MGAKTVLREVNRPNRKTLAEESVDETPNKDKQRKQEVSEVIEQETARGTSRRPRRGRHETLVDEFEECVRTGDLQRMLRVLRAEGYSAEQRAAFSVKWREQRGDAPRKVR